MAESTFPYDITIEGTLTVDEAIVLCPSCAATTQLTVYGTLQGPVRLMCPEQHHFAPPVDGPTLLRMVIADPLTGLEVLPLPD